MLQRPAREHEEERHVALVHEPDEKVEHDGRIRRLHVPVGVVERPGRVEREEQRDGADAQPIDVVAPVRGVDGHPHLIHATAGRRRRMLRIARSIRPS